MPGTAESWNSMNELESVTRCRQPCLTLAALAFLGILNPGCGLLPKSHFQGFLDEFGDGHSFYNYDVVIEKLRREAKSDHAESTPRQSFRTSVTTGFCNEGRMRVLENAGFMQGVMIFYEAESRDFVSIQSYRRYCIPPYYAVNRYWPRRQRMRDFTVTEQFKPRYRKVSAQTTDEQKR